MRQMTEKEKELANYLITNNNFEKEEFIALGLLCNSEERAAIMLEYLKENPNNDFDTLLEKAIKIHQNN